MKKLSKLEQKLLNCMGSEHVSSKVLMDRLYVGMNRPKTNTISTLVSRLRAKGVKIETLRGKGYRVASGRNMLLASAGMVREASYQLPSGLAYGGSIPAEIKGMLARYGLNFSVVADLAMKAIRAIATPVPAYLLTSPPKYGAVDFVRNAEGVYQAE